MEGKVSLEAGELSSVQTIAPSELVKIWVAILL